MECVYHYRRTDWQTVHHLISANYLCMTSMNVFNWYPKWASPMCYELVPVHLAPMCYDYVLTSCPLDVVVMTLCEVQGYDIGMSYWKILQNLGVERFPITLKFDKCFCNTDSQPAKFQGNISLLTFILMWLRLQVLGHDYWILKEFVPS